MSTNHENRENADALLEINSLLLHLKRNAPKGTPIVALLFTDGGQSGETFYASSVPNEQLIKSLEEFIVKLKERL